MKRACAVIHVRLEETENIRPDPDVLVGAEGDARLARPVVNVALEEFSDRFQLVIPDVGVMLSSVDRFPVFPL